jgi:hypothetical protein
MGFFSKLTSTVVQIALLPVEAAKDGLTLFGAVTDQREPYTIQRLKKLGRTVGSAIDDLNN